MKNNASRLSGKPIAAGSGEQVSAQLADAFGRATEPSPAGAAKRVGLAWLAIAVVSAHLALLLWVAARLPTRAVSTAATPAAHRWLLARALAAPATSPDEGLAFRPATGARPPAATPAVARPLSPLPLPRPAAVAEPAAADAADPAAAELPPAVETRFYGYDEVETPAQPQADWAIDVQAFDALALSRIVVTLWVDERGNVLRCAVDEPARLSPAERDALAERIARTALRPARRDGVAVASKRRIELTTTGG